MKLKFTALTAVALLAACAGPASQPESARTYVLDARPAAAQPPPRRDVVLAVGMPRARPGFDAAQMAYVRRAHEIEYFAQNRWADAPARMLAPLLVQALEQSGGFRAVVQSPGTASADLRLEVEIVRLLQDFTASPSRIRFTLRAQVIDAGTRRVLATREFDEVEPAASENAYGGVLAANQALERLLRQMVDFTAEQAAGR